MRVLGFRTRLALFFVATLVLVQGLTAVLAYDVARRQLEKEGRHQLTANTGVFVARMNNLSASVPMDDALIVHLQQLSALPRDIELATPNGDGYTVIARGSGHAGLTASFSSSDRSLPSRPTLVSIDGSDYLVLTQVLRQTKGGAAVYAVLGYSLDDALRPYRPVWKAWLVLLAIGLGTGLLVAWLVARGVSQPVQALTAAARRLAGGDYRAAPEVHRRDEIGELATAFRTMGEAVRERERHIRHQATHEGVTGLPNRIAAEEAIDQDLAAAPGQQGALLIVGVTRLPDITRTLGHALAGRLMRNAGARLCQAAGTHYVARTSDTHFAVWLRGADRAEALSVAFRVMDALGKPYQEVGIGIDMGPAVGIALAPSHGERASVLLRRAEVAEVAAVGSARGVDTYDRRSDPQRPERLLLMSELRNAIDSDVLELYYQPTRRLSDGCMEGAEALVRWPRPGRGMIASEQFMAVAEATGNIGRLTHWVLARGIAQAAELARAGRPLRLSIHLSARDICDTELPDRVAHLLHVHRLSSTSLILEVTERAVTGEPEAAVQVLRRLADMGIDIAIGDVGAAQTSFAYLRRLPVRELKIAKMLVQHLATDETDRVIVRSLVELGHRLGCRVTAAGVEDEATAAFLGDIGCDHAQGIHIDRPMTLAALVARHGAQGGFTLAT